MAEEKNEFEPIETQEAFDERIKSRIERAQNQVRNEYEGFEEYKKKAEAYDSKISEYEKNISALQGKVTTLQSEIAKRDTGAAKNRIAKDFGLPEEFADRLEGDSEEAWKEDAKKLAKYFERPTVAYPRKDTAEHVGPRSGDMLAMLRKLRGE